MSYPDWQPKFDFNDDLVCIERYFDNENVDDLAPSIEMVVGKGITLTLIPSALFPAYRVNNAQGECIGHISRETSLYLVTLYPRAMSDGQIKYLRSLRK